MRKKKGIEPKEVEDGIIIKASLLADMGIYWLLDCEGDVESFSKKLCGFDPEKEELEAPKWLLADKFPGEF